MTRIFGGIETERGTFEKAAVLLQSVPFDGTSTWGKGADKGFEEFMDATDNMELYDIETDSEVYERGVWILPEVNGKTAEEMFRNVYGKAKELLKTGKFLTFFGGEHSISIGVIKAFYEAFPDITILQLDAHADLRPEYMGTPYNHACALYDASKNTNLIQVGIRSMDQLEMEHLSKKKCFFMQDIHDNDVWMDRSIELMGDQVYITLDLDVFDPSILPGTGTPEPGGMKWYPMLTYLKKVFEKKEVLGFDIVELAPIEGLPASEFLVSKLYYKMLSYKFEHHGK
ncbi:MAG: agmatinase [Marinilabiliales bacterium]|nr:MAG: agmatinase [Marinilabiliales bacterium]